ncbi:hypothetical protein TELCIR_15671, partial [Teladorsagia circumcincta]
MVKASCSYIIPAYTILDEYLILTQNSEGVVVPVVISSYERHSGMLDWYADQFNFVVFGTDVHPQDRSQLILQFRPPDLSQIIGPIRADLIKIANPGPTELEPLLQVQIRQNLSYDPALVMISPDEKQRQVMLEEVAQLMLDIDK